MLAKKLPLVLLFLLFFHLLVFADFKGTDLKWLSASENLYEINITADHTPELNQVVEIKVSFSKQGVLLSGDINGTITKPDASTESFNFVQTGDGNHQYNFLFEQNGAYTLDITAVDENGFLARKRDYFYVGAYNINRSIISQQDFLPNSIVTIMVYASVNPPLVRARGTISINYPNGNALVSNANLTESTTPGYYSYSFTAPNILGTYTYNITMVSGANSVSKTGSININVLGAICGNGFCETNETCTNCESDCGACTMPTPIQQPGGGSGGGTGGGGSFAKPTPTPETFEKPKIRAEGISVKPFELGSPAIISGKIINSSDKKATVLVSVIIQYENTLEYVDERVYLDILPSSSQDFSMLLPWTPKIAGSHVMTLTLYSIDKTVKFDEQVKVFELPGEMRYDLEIKCITQNTAAGLPAYFEIFAYNLGQYYSDIGLYWFIEDSEGKVQFSSSTPFALKPDEKATKAFIATIPQNAKSGIYTARAKLLHLENGNQPEREAICTFNVLSQPNYYALEVFDLNKRLEEAQSAVEELKLKGKNVLSIELKISQARLALFEIETLIGNRNFEGIELKLIDLFKKINDIEKEIEQIKKEPVFDFTIVLFLIYGLILLLLGFFFYRHMRLAAEREEKFSKILEANIRSARKAKSLIPIGKSLWHEPQHKRLMRKIHETSHAHKHALSHHKS
ncbi:MAG: hypothetical protein QXK06_05360 [Candidatus Diapherotrites archaeon]